MKVKSPPHVAHSQKAARKAGLRYVNDAMPGIYRRQNSSGFYYIDSAGRHVKEQEILSRIKSIVIPPAWKEVWISPLPTGHIQAVGRDARGRKQYRYHPDWVLIRSQNKFFRMTAFAEVLTDIREQVDKDLSESGISRRKVTAAVIRLMEKSYARIGNIAYARENKSYGITTLRDRHVEIEGSRIRLSFNGKKGVKQEIEFSDRRLAGIVKKCRDIPGYELFQYYDGEGERHTIESGDVNEYLREITGEDFSAKDFRTWAGSVEALTALKELGHIHSQKERKSTMVHVIKEVARILGNTPAVCKKYYIHPFILNAFEKGHLHKIIHACEVSQHRRLSFEECLLVKLLEQAQEGPQAKPE